MLIKTIKRILNSFYFLIKKLIHTYFSSVLDLNFSVFEKKIDSRLTYWIEGVDLFHVTLKFFYLFSFFSKFYLKIYRAFVRVYPDSKITRWLIKNTKLGTFRVYSNAGAILVIRTFVWFKGRLIHIESYYLNQHGMTFKQMSILSSTLTESFSSRRERLFSENCLPANVSFDAIAIAPGDSSEDYNIIKWEFWVDYFFFE